jgi:hypothetical protein
MVISMNFFFKASLLARSILRAKILLKCSKEAVSVLSSASEAALFAMIAAIVVMVSLISEALICLCNYDFVVDCVVIHLLVQYTHIHSHVLLGRFA